MSTNWDVMLLVEELELDVTVLTNVACVAWLLWHLPSFPGRQLSHFFSAFAHGMQFLQLPVLLQRQHVISVALLL